MKAFARSMVLVLCCVLSACTRAAQPVPCVAERLLDPAATFVAPPNNATGIPATVGSVTFSVSISQLHQGIFWLALMGVDAPGPTVAVVPYQTDSSGTATVAIPTLSPHGTYVGTVATNGSGCGGATGNLGRFTVQ